MSKHRLFSSAVIMSNNSTISAGSSSSRGRLLDAARGLLLKSTDGGASNNAAADKSSPSTAAATTKITPLRCFALKAEHVQQGTSNLIGATPSDFHARLVGLIRGAQRRISLASLYIGPAAMPQHSPRELELLQALEGVPSHVDVQIVMDRNRGLRKVPCNNSKGSSNDGSTTTTTSAAQAVAKAIHLQSNHQLYLCQVLPNPLDRLLPNPLNEVAGVFHIKAYLVDDTLILSGANLSEEYFLDRQDRYFQIQGHESLVDFYAQLIDILCQEASEPYHVEPSQQQDENKQQQATRKSTTTVANPAQFWKKIHDLFGDPDSSPLLSTAADALLEDPETVAVCVPTFHHPQLPIPPPPSSSSSSVPTIPSDIDCTLNLLRQAAANANANANANITDNSDAGGDDVDHHTAAAAATTSVQLSSAYLNPPPDLLKALSQFSHIDFLTAGPLSHGFRPKSPTPLKAPTSEAPAAAVETPTMPTSDAIPPSESAPPSPKSAAASAAGNKGKAWIPTVFDHLQAQAMNALDKNHQRPTLWHWQRPGWTFHAKGLWITTTTTIATTDTKESPSTSSQVEEEEHLAAAIVGSSNFGRRSWERDMESNLILVFPEEEQQRLQDGASSSLSSSSSSSSSLAIRLRDEWKNLLQHSEELHEPHQQILAERTLPWHVRVCYPFIQSFF